MRYKYLPVSLSLEKSRCLIVGGGKVALRKIDILLDYETDITVIAPEVDDKIRYYAEKKLLHLESREYQPGDIDRSGIVIAASDKNDVNELVFKGCRAAHIPVNVVDNPALCDFIFPAVVRRNSLSVAVSTDGMAPFLSGHLRLILENIFPRNWTKIADLAVEFRQMVMARWAGNPEKKTAAFSKFLEADWKDILKKKKGAELHSFLEEMIPS